MMTRARIISGVLFPFSFMQTFTIRRSNSVKEIQLTFVLLVYNRVLRISVQFHCRRCFNLAETGLERRLQIENGDQQLRHEGKAAQKMNSHKE